MLKNKVDAFLKKYSINDKKVLIAFSGGYDSMCLLDIIAKLQNAHKLTPIAIHLNHNWRGEESRKEEENCRQFCNEHSIEFYSETISSEIKQTETDAREARYKFFEKCANKFKTNIIFTAHNADDNAETLIYRLTKGTGTKGLEGIAEVREIYYRPLLKIYRNEIEKYCKNENLTPNKDSSNENTKYKRNHIRKIVLPELEKINKKAKIAINALSEIATLDNEIITEYLAKLPDKFNTKNFCTYSNAIKSRIIYDFLITNNLDYNKKIVDKILSFIETNQYLKNGKTLSLTTEMWLFVNNKEIRLIHKKQQNKHKIKLEKCTTRPEKFPHDKDFIAYVDLTNFDTNLEIRTRQDGDIITPLGSNGTQKLKKYLNAKAIPKDKRDEMLFLCHGKEILWVPGIGLNEKIKVKTNPTHILKLEYDNEHK